ncbi:MAG: hypothetical protein MI976_18490 [Pseudomonadales bacterium]|nr:hypothetical protein [Pseudomonadales bacterium]
MAEAPVNARSVNMILAKCFLTLNDSKVRRLHKQEGYERSSMRLATIFAVTGNNSFQIALDFVIYFSAKTPPFVNFMLQNH